MRVTKTVVLPSTLEVIGGSGVYDLGQTTDATRGAFRDCTALENVVLPNNLKTIEKHAFSGCTSLKSIKFPDSLTTLGDFAFRNCDNLADVTYGSGMTSTGKYAFYNSGVKNIMLSSSITKIDNYSFFGCKMTTVELPDSVESIGIRAFANCSFLKHVTINNAYASFNGIAADDPFNGSSQSIIFYGHKGSTTETYVDEHTSSGYTFVSIDSCNHITTHEEITLAPTCTEKGIQSVICDYCKVAVSQTEIPATGHMWVVTETSDETEQNGHIYTYSHCSVCREEKTDIEHTAYVEGFYTYSNTATCERSGTETYRCTVENCGKFKITPVLARHSVDNYVTTVEPTCSEAGKSEGVCTICGKTDTKTILPTGHKNELTETLDNTSVNGHTFDVYTCSACGAQTSVPNHIEWMEGEYTSTILFEPRCVLDGSQRDVCNTCGENRLVAIPANGEHVWYETSRTEPTCTAVGKIYYACENCNLTKSDNIDALGHDYQLIEESCVPATCTTAGYNTKKCSRCAASARDVISALGHTVDETNYTINQEPDCETKGSASSVCKVCGQSFDMVIEALGHNYENVVVDIADKPGHSLSTPTCTRSGCNSVQAASVIHDEWLEGQYETTVITEGNCTIGQITRDTCTICNVSRTNTAQAPGHNLKYLRTGNTGTLYYNCTVCGNNVLRTADSIIALWNESYINTYPEDMENGYLFECTGDGFINAKDYSVLARAKALSSSVIPTVTTTQPSEETTAPAE